MEVRGCDDVMHTVRDTCSQNGTWSWFSVYQREQDPVEKSSHDYKIIDLRRYMTRSVRVIDREYVQKDEQWKRAMRLKAENLHDMKYTNGPLKCSLTGE